MIILSAKKKFKGQSKKNEAVRKGIPVLNFETFIQEIASKKFIPNIIDIDSFQLARFHITIVEKFTATVKTNSVSFLSQSQLMNILIEEKDVHRISRNPPDTKPLFFQIEMKNGLVFFIQRIR
jgi:hypothetical protein